MCKSHLCRWSGCSDNVHYGNAFSKTFTEQKGQQQMESKEVALVNDHNSEAGRVVSWLCIVGVLAAMLYQRCILLFEKVLLNSLETICKCHGVSGSCELRTCWRRMKKFRVIGDILKKKFDGATEVEVQRRAHRSQLAPANPFFKRHSADDLVYVRQSPDYCQPNNVTGLTLTSGRQCNITSAGTDGCELLCCNRGYRIRQYARREKCDCKFQWCCTVKCKECIEEVKEYVCI